MATPTTPKAPRKPAATMYRAWVASPIFTAVGEAGGHEVRVEARTNGGFAVTIAGHPDATRTFDTNKGLRNHIERVTGTYVRSWAPAPEPPAFEPMITTLGLGDEAVTVTTRETNTNTYLTRVSGGNDDGRWFLAYTEPQVRTNHRDMCNVVAGRTREADADSVSDDPNYDAVAHEQAEHLRAIADTTHETAPDVPMTAKASAALLRAAQHLTIEAQALVMANLRRAYDEAGQKMCFAEDVREAVLQAIGLVE